MVKWEGIRAIFHFSLSAKNTHTHTPSPYHKERQWNSLFHIYVCFSYVYMYISIPWRICLWILFGSLATRHIDMPHNARLLSLTFTLPLLLSLSISSHSKCINTKCFFCKSVSDCTLLHEITQLLIRWPFVIRSSLFHLDKSTAMKTMLIPTKKIRRKINLT